MTDHDHTAWERDLWRARGMGHPDDALRALRLRREDAIRYGLDPVIAEQEERAWWDRNRRPGTAHPGRQAFRDLALAVAREYGNGSPSEHYVAAFVDGWLAAREATPDPEGPPHA